MTQLYIVRSLAEKLFRIANTCLRTPDTRYERTSNSLGCLLRFEPYVLPKKSLTGDATERVDTRVLQAIYRIADEKAPVYVGQQMDVYIETPVAAMSNRTTKQTQKAGGLK